MYYVLFILAFILLLFARTGYKKLVLQLDFIGLFVFSALRYNFGNDYPSYLRYFENVKNGITSLSIQETGFYYLNKAFPNFYLLIAVISAIYLYVVYKLIINYLEPSEYPYALFVFIIDPYVFLMSLSMVRQTIAVLLFIFAIYLWKKKKIVWYVAICILASTIHSSAIILLPFFLVFNEKKDFFIKPQLLIPSIAGVFAFSTTILSPIIDYVLRLFNDANYYYYINSIQTNSVRATLLSSISLLYICLNLNKLSGERLAYSKLSVFATLFDVFAFRFAMIGRVGSYFSVFRLISLPAIFMTNYKKSVGIDRLVNVYILPSLVFIIYVVRVYSFLTNPMWQSFTHYQTILDLI